MCSYLDHLDVSASFPLLFSDSRSLIAVRPSRAPYLAEAIQSPPSFRYPSSFAYHLGCIFILLYPSTMLQLPSSSLILQVLPALSVVVLLIALLFAACSPPLFSSVASFRPPMSASPPSFVL